MVLYFFSNSWLIDSCMESRVMYHAVPHTCAAFRCILYRTLFSFYFFLYKNLILSLSRIVCIFSWVMFVAGDVYGIFILAYFGTTLLVRYCQLK